MVYFPLESFIDDLSINIDSGSLCGGFTHREKEFLDITTLPSRFSTLLEIIKKLHSQAYIQFP